MQLTNKLRKIFINGLLITSAILSSPLLASEIDDSNAEEKVGLFVRGLKICHQGEWRNMTVNLEYQSELQGKAQNVQDVKNFVRLFLENYPNTTDFWEIMNTKLVSGLTQNFPDLITLSSTLALAPDRTLSFPRESKVFYDKNASVLKEYFKFTKLKYLICNQTFKSLDLHVAFELKDNPGPWDYPDYQWVDQAMEEFFIEHPVSLSAWKDIKPMLEAFLLDRFKTLTSLNIDVTVAE